MSATLAATAGNTHVLLSWSAPADDGGSAITGYVVEYSGDVGSSWMIFADDNGALTTGADTTSARVTGPENGHAYQFRISATNVIGTGTPDTTDATPLTVPGPPTDLDATRNGTTQIISLSWSAPADNGGSIITDYVI